MTNLDIIKYLAHNNPDRLAEFLDDIYCIGWNCGAYEQRHIDDDDTSAVDIDFVESKWLDQKAGEDFFLDDELKEWSEFTEWISVKDRLPAPYDKDPDWTETVLFRTTQGHIHSGYRYKAQVETFFSPSYWLDESENLSFEDEDVTHWMPLPTPPME